MPVNSDVDFGNNLEFIESLYAKYLQDKDSVSERWRDFFADQSVVGDGFSIKNKGSFLDFIQNNNDVSQLDLEVGLSQALPKSPSKSNDLKAANLKATNDVKSLVGKESLVSAGSASDDYLNQMAYRSYGFLMADLNPLQAEDSTKSKLPKHDVLQKVAGFAVRRDSRLESIYCGKIGFEFMHLTNAEERSWLYDRIENSRPLYNTKKRGLIFDYLVRSVGFEQFLHKRFPGAKRFSLEGGEAIIPALHFAFEGLVAGGYTGVEMAMAHRGRLNVLVNICGKKMGDIFALYSGKIDVPTDLVSGDVKYHMGYSSELGLSSGKMKISLAYNPSHLEAVNSVVLGRVRAKQDMLGDVERNKIAAFMIHGDAAIAGQGTVAETFNMSLVKSVFVGGTVHYVIDNQIGFTAESNESRSSRYASDIAKFIEAPIIHVNGDSVEDVVYASELACDYKRRFQKDVVVNIICFRKYGHNEGDEPMFTQPLMYKRIHAMKSIDLLYEEEIKSQIGEAKIDEIREKFKDNISAEFQRVESSGVAEQIDYMHGKWKNMKLASYAGEESEQLTGVDENILKEIARSLYVKKEGSQILPKVEKLYEGYQNDIKEGNPVEWSVGEALAFATCLQEGHRVRLVGQDAERGTFSHRHAVITDTESGETYIPLAKFAKNGAVFEVYNSVLSEYSAMGYEYGYAQADPNSLVIWEAQFGDFVNGAQIIIDQFLAAGEQKWLRSNGLVLLLPHGYEGQGPEHSSARLERFLQLCAQNNMEVIYPTTPANIFHGLRRQLKRDFRRPLIVMTPKSLLRNKLARSHLQAMGKGTSFLKVMVDRVDESAPIKRVIFCTGKIFYEAITYMKDNNIKDAALVRLEQLYPFPDKEVAEVIKNLVKQGVKLYWLQEEPENMGAWRFINDNFMRYFEIFLQYLGRPESASTASGYVYVHNKEMLKLLDKLK